MRGKRGNWLGRGAWVALWAGLLLPACSVAPGAIFPASEQTVVWPGAPATPRIRYVGQLRDGDDLKPGKNTFQVLGELLFGRHAPQSLLRPYALVSDGASRLFISDTQHKVVHVLDLETRRCQAWQPPKLAQPAQLVGLAYRPQTQQLFVSDSANGVIYVFDKDGKVQDRLGAGVLQRPCGLAFDSLGQRLLIADALADQVVALSPEGQLLQRIGARGAGLGQFHRPVNVAVAADGGFYVADALNSRVQQFSPQGAVLRQIGARGDSPGSFSQPKGLAVNSEQHLYVIDSRFEAVQIFDATGQLLLSFGQEGHGPGEFWLPAGLYIDPHDRIWVADCFNARVQAFDYSPGSQP